MCLGVGQVCHMFVPTILEMGGLQILLFQELIDNGNIEELFLHEGSHVSVDSLLEVKHHFGPLFCILQKIFIFIKSKNLMNFDQGTDAWLCARQRDNNFISTYAADNPTRLYEPYLGSKYESIIDTYIKQL